MVRHKSPHWVDKHVGEELGRRRGLAGISQAKLAESIGVSFQQIQKYERAGNRIAPSRLFEVALYLDVPVADFFPASDEKMRSAAAATGSLSLEEIRLVSHYRELSDCERPAVFAFVSMLGKANRKVKDQSVPDSQSLG